MAEQSLLLWGFGLMIAALLLFGLEIFIPSGGLLGAAAIVTAVAAVVNFWRVSPTFGVISLLVMMVLVPMAINLGLRVMPHTPVGKRLILSEQPVEMEQRALEEQKEFERQQALVGALGLAITPLRPVGSVEIDGTRFEVLAEGGAIEAGQRVRVTSVSGNQIKVRAVV